MRSIRTLTILTAAIVGLFATGTAYAKDHDPMEHGSKSSAPAADQDAWLAKAKAAYPLNTCVVSDEKLEGDMGGPVDFVYKQDGKPDRLVRFCCKSCIKDFKKAPAKYLKKIDDAVAAKGGAEHSHHM